MTVFLLTCWVAGVPIECGQYIDRDRCLRAGPYIAVMTSIEFGVPQVKWRCEERRI